MQSWSVDRPAKQSKAQVKRKRQLRDKAEPGYLPGLSQHVRVDPDVNSEIAIWGASWG